MEYPIKCCLSRRALFFPFRGERDTLKKKTVKLQENAEKEQPGSHRGDFHPTSSRPWRVYTIALTSRGRASELIIRESQKIVGFLFFKYFGFL